MAVPQVNQNTNQGVSAQSTAGGQIATSAATTAATGAATGMAAGTGAASGATGALAAFWPLAVIMAAVAGYKNRQQFNKIKGQLGTLTDEEIENTSDIFGIDKYHKKFEDNFDKLNIKPTLMKLPYMETVNQYVNPLHNPVANIRKVLYGSNKHGDQLIRDRVRRGWETMGFAQKNERGSHQVTLADGTTYDIGVDGSNRFQNVDGTSRRSYEFDASNPNTSQTIGMLQPIGVLTAGGHDAKSLGKVTSDSTGLLGNAAMSNANGDIKVIQQNARGFYEQMFGAAAKEAGMTTREFVAKGLEFLRDNGRITEEEYLAYANGVNQVYGQSPLLPPETPIDQNPAMPEGAISEDTFTAGNGIDKPIVNPTPEQLAKIQNYKAQGFATSSKDVTRSTTMERPVVGGIDQNLFQNVPVSGVPQQSSIAPQPQQTQPQPAPQQPSQFQVYQQGSPAPTNPFSRLISQEEGQRLQSQGLSVSGVPTATGQVTGVPAEAPASNAPQPVTSETSVPGLRYADRGRILWKPYSDSDGNLAVLLPYNPGGAVIRDNATGQVISTGRPIGSGNGFQQTYRFDRPGSEYQNVTIEFANGTTMSVGDGSLRYENQGSGTPGENIEASGGFVPPPSMGGEIDMKKQLALSLASQMVSPAAQTPLSQEMNQRQRSAEVSKLISPVVMGLTQGI